MRKMILILATIILGSYGSLDWKEPELLFGGKLNITYYDVMLDSSSITHLAICTKSVDNKGTRKQNLIYMKLDMSNKVLHKTDFNIQTGCNVVKISTYQNDKNLIIAYEGERQYNSRTCDKTNTNGCHDIFLTSSYNGGIQWIEITQVKRKNLTDAAERLDPYFVPTKVNNAIILYYTERDIIFDESNIMRVIYISKSFGDEEESFRCKKIIPMTMIDNSEESPALMFFEGYDRFIHYIHTYKNFKYWISSQLFINERKCTSFAKVSIGNELIVVGVFTDGAKTYIRTNINCTRFWSSRILLSKGDHKVSTSSLILTADSKASLTILTIDSMNKNQKQFDIVIPGGKPIVSNPPFTTLKNNGLFLLQIRPYIGNTKYIHKAFAYIKNNETHSALYGSNYGN